MTISLTRGSTVCIIGGGPAGCFAALHLIRLTAERDLDLNILLFEPHDGCTQGPRSCKGCAGILSSGAVAHLAALGLSIPSEVVQSELHSYVVHVRGEVATIQQPDPRRRILSVYRGAGPRLHEGDSIAGFDTFLLDQVRAKGVRVIPERVRVVEPGDRPVIRTDAGEYVADLVVLATGVNSRAPLGRAFGYVPPETARMAQDEILRPPDWPAQKVAGFFGGLPGLVFGAFVPKGEYLNVSLLYRGSAENPVRAFYQAQADALVRFLPKSPNSMCGCRPHIAVGPAKEYYGDRWVAVGDAAVTRLYKDGINSAFMAAGAAMKTAVLHGVSRSDFRRGYAPHCRRLALDNAVGKLMFWVSSHMLQSKWVARSYLFCVREEGKGNPARRLHSRLLWGMLTGDEPYHVLMGLALRPRAIWTMGISLIQSALKRHQIAS